MANSLFISTIFLVVLVIPGFCEKLTVCKEDDGDIRIDCEIEPKPSNINSYEFSISMGGKETVINTNVTGTAADLKFKAKTQVESLGTKGYRLRLSNHEINANTTFTCKASGKSKHATVEKDKMVTCSAISLFLHSCPWLLSTLFFLHFTQSWVLSAP